MAAVASSDEQHEGFSEYQPQAEEKDGEGCKFENAYTPHNANVPMSCDFGQDGCLSSLHTRRTLVMTRPPNEMLRVGEMASPMGHVKLLL